MKKTIQTFILLLMWGSGAFLAHASLIDGFDSYSDGDLNGQGSWGTATDFQVQGSTVFSGTKAVKVSAGSVTIKKSFTPQMTGSQRVSGRVADSTTTGLWTFRIYESPSSPVITIRTSSNKLQYFDGSTYNDIGTVAGDTWFTVDIEWRSSDFNARYSLNGGSWTAWDTAWGASWSSGLDEIRLVNDSASASDAFWDELDIGGGTPASPAAASTVLWSYFGTSTPIFTATTTVSFIDWPVGDLFLGFLIFFISMFFVVWVFRKNI